MNIWILCSPLRAEIRTLRAQLAKAEAELQAERNRGKRLWIQRTRLFITLLRAGIKPSTAYRNARHAIDIGSNSQQHG